MMEDTNAAPAHGPNETPVLTFAVPVKATDDAAERRFRCRMLSATLRSLFAQTDGAFRVMVALDRAPEIDFATDWRFEWVPNGAGPTESKRAANSDLGVKLFAMATLLAQRGGGYFMPVDMDDFVSRDLVAFVRANPDPNGYVMQSGYVLDASTNRIAPLLDAGGRFGPLNKECGTSAIINLAPGDVLGGFPQARYNRLRERGHYMQAEAAVAERRPLMPIPFRAVVYTVSHGGNLSQATGDTTGQADARQRMVEAVSAEGLPSSLLAEEFSLPDRYPRIEDYAADTLGIFPKMSGPTLSVVIATYKRPAGLRRLLAALRPQIYRRSGREIVVVNDGSHDDAYETVRAEFADIIKYRALPKNLGVAAARNATARLSTGDYIVFTDDDCEPPSWWLDWLAARLMRAPDLDVIAGPTSALPPERWRFFSKVQANHRILPAPSRSSGGILFVTANVAIRRSLFEQLGGFGFPGRFHGAGEDTELANRLSLAGAAMTIDDAWFVRHEVESTLRSVCRRYWRYGYANVSLMPLTTSPQVHDSLVGYRRGRHLRNWLSEYREQRKFAVGVSRSRLVQMLSTLAASGVRMAYYDGCSAALRDRDRHRVQADTR